MILVRHGESEFNVAFNKTRVDPGIRDPALTEEGHRQAARAAQALAAMAPERQIRRVLASPYRRALQTGQIIADALDVPLVVEPLVREHAVFVCDLGTPRTALCESWPSLAFGHLEEEWWRALGETEDELRARCTAFRAQMAQVEDWRETAVVSHWGFILRLTGKRVTNCELLEFDPTAEPVQFSLEGV